MVLAAAETAGESLDNLRQLLAVLDGSLQDPDAGGGGEADWNTVRRSLDHHKTAMGVWDAHYDPPDATLPLRISLVSAGEPVPLIDAAREIGSHHDDTRALLASEEQNALRALLEGLIASELADKMHRCSEMVRRMNEILGPIRTTQQIGAGLRWQAQEGSRRSDRSNGGPVGEAARDAQPRRDHPAERRPLRAASSRERRESRRRLRGADRRRSWTTSGGMT